MDDGLLWSQTSFDFFTLDMESTNHTSRCSQSAPRTFTAVAPAPMLPFLLASFRVFPVTMSATYQDILFPKPRCPFVRLEVGGPR